MNKKSIAISGLFLSVIFFAFLAIGLGSFVHAQVANSGDVMIEAVGSNLATSTAPVGITSNIDSSSPSSLNPNTYYNSSASIHTAYIKYIPGYSVSVASCIFARSPGTECAVSSFTPAGLNCDYNTNICNYSFNVSADYITKIVFKYDVGSNGDLMIKRVGSDLYTSSAPSNTAMSVDTATGISTNPYTYTSLSTATKHRVYATYLPNTYKVSFGDCTYNRGDNECSVTTFSTYEPSCDSVTGLCSYDYSVTENQITKVVAKYDSLAQGSYTGDIQAKIVGSDLYTSSAPSGTSIKIDNLSAAPTNPYTYTNQILSTHSSYVTYKAGYTISFGQCTYNRGGTECPITSFWTVPVGSGDQHCDINTGVCRYDVTASANTVTKVVWKYDPSSSTFSGNTLIQRVGPDQTPVSLSASGTYTQIDGGSNVTTNPIQTTLSTNANHIVRVAYVPGYDVQIASCQYASGTTQCVPNFSGNAGAYANYDNNNYCNTTTNLCRIDVYVSSGYIYNIAFRYIPSASGDMTVERVGLDQTISSVPITTQIKVGSAGTLTSSNPASSTLAADTSYPVYFTYNPAYTISIGTCTYARNGTPCTNYSLGTIYDAGSSYDNSGYCNTTSNLCRLDVTVSQNQVTRMVVRYVPLSGGDLSIERVGVDQTTSSVPLATQIKVGTAGTLTSSNPASSTLAANTSYPVYFTYNSAYTISIGVCMYARGGIPCTDYSLATTWGAGSSYDNSGYCNTTTNLCRYDVNINQNQISRLIIRYIPTASGDITIERIGSDQTTSSVSLSTQVKISSAGTLTTSNPAKSTLAANTTYAVYFTYNPAYTINFGSCSYLRGGTPCTNYGLNNYYGTSSSDSNGYCNTTTNLCHYDVTVYQDGISRVVVRYVSTSGGSQTNPNPDASKADIRVKLVGPDLYASSAPAGISIKVDSLPSTNVNPTMFYNQDITTHSVYTSYNPSYKISVGTCTYNRGDNECAVTNFSNSFSLGSGNQACDQFMNLCRYDVTGSAGIVTKVVWKYELNNQQQNSNLSVSDGDLMIKRVGSDLYASSAPSNTTANMDSYMPTATNPYTYTHISTSIVHRVYATYLSGTYTTSFGSCTYARGGTECSVTSFSPATCDSNTGLCSNDYSVSANMVTKVVWKYDLGSSTFSGNTLIQRVGPDQTPVSLSAPGTFTQIDGGSNNTTNPIQTTLTTNANHIIRVAYVPGYDVQMASCQYPSGTTPCIPNLSATAGAYANYDNSTYCNTTTNLCRLDVFVSSGYVSNVAFRYIPISNGDLTIERVGADQTTSSVPLSTQIKIGSAGTFTSSNPASSTLAANTTYAVYFTYNPAYDINFGSCTYARGGIPCTNYALNAYYGTNTSDSNGYCNTTTNLCHFDVTTTQDQVTRMVVRYMPLSGGDLTVERIGADQTTASVPLVTQIKVGSTGTLTSFNPATTTLAAATNYTTYSVYFTYNPAYNINVGQCTYVRGGTPCTNYTLDSIYDAGSSYDSSRYCNTTTNLCRLDVFINPNQVTRMVVRYLPAGNGDVTIERIGPDQTIASVPIATQVKIGSTGVLNSLNPYVKNNLISGGYSIYFTYNSAYDISLGSCQYYRGGTPCTNYGLGTYASTAAGDNNLYCDTTTNLCRLDVNIIPNQITRTVAQYVLKGTDQTGSNTGDIEIKRVGTDLYASSAPATSVSAIDAQTLISSPNPITYLNQTPNQHVAYASYIPGYAISVGWCTYARGLGECAVTNFDVAACDVNRGMCSYTINAISTNAVYKLVWKYDSLQQGNYTSDIMVKAVGKDLYASSAPSTVSVKVDNQATAPTNPYTYQNQTLAIHSVYATYRPGYSISAGYCTYTRNSDECAVTSFSNPYSLGTENLTCDQNTGLCRYDVNLNVNTGIFSQVYKVVWKYDPLPTGDIMVKSVGTDLYTSSAPTGTKVWVDSQTPSAINPVLFPNLALAVTPDVSGATYNSMQHSVYATYFPSTYDTTVSSCTYTRGSNECAVTDFGKNGLACDIFTHICSYQVPVQENMITKVAWKYDPILSNQFSLSNSGDITTPAGSSVTNTITATKKSGAPDQNITFAVSGMPNGVTTSFSNPSCMPSCSTILTFNVPSTTVKGTYPIRVFDSGTGIYTGFDLVVLDPDPNSQTGDGNTPQNPKPQLYCSVSPTSANIGTSVRWTAMVSVAGSYTYSWTGDDLSGSDVTSTISKTYATEGTKSIQVTVSGTDVNGDILATSTCSKSITISKKPSFTEF